MAKRIVVRADLLTRIQALYVRKVGPRGSGVRSLDPAVPWFAAMVGVSGRAVQRWVSGQRPVPRWAFLVLELLEESEQGRLF